MQLYRNNNLQKSNGKNEKIIWNKNWKNEKNNMEKIGKLKKKQYGKTLWKFTV
jgi:hypothetical protein